MRGFMKKQLLLSILTAGLIGGYAQAVDTKDLVQAIQDRDGDVFFDLIDDLYSAKNQEPVTFVQELLTSGVDLNSYLDFEKEGTARAIDALLFYALDMDEDTGDLKATKFLLENGANPNVNLISDKPLFYAVGLDNLSAVQLLLDHGANVNATDQNGETALMKAAKKDNVSMKDLLLKYGADVKLKDNKGYTVLMHAAYANPFSNEIDAGFYPFKFNVYVHLLATNKDDFDKNEIAKAKAVMLKRSEIILV